MSTDQTSIIVSALGSSFGWKIFLYISVGLYALLNINALVASFFWLLVLLFLLTFMLAAWFASRGFLQVCGTDIVRGLFCGNKN